MGGAVATGADSVKRRMLLALTMISGSTRRDPDQVPQRRLRPATRSRAASRSCAVPDRPVLPMVVSKVPVSTREPEGTWRSLPWR